MKDRTVGRAQAIPRTLAGEFLDIIDMEALGKLVMQADKKKKAIGQHQDWTLPCPPTHLSVLCEKSHKSNLASWPTEPKR